MQERFLMATVQPAAYKAMSALDKYVNGTGIEKLETEIIKIRASQINGCAYCVNHHTKEARLAGETEQRIYLINVWREAGNVFTEKERLILAMTEEITLIHEQGFREALYEKAIQTFGEEKTAQIIMIIITINAWNRVGVSLNMHPEKE